MGRTSNWFRSLLSSKKSSASSPAKESKKKKKSAGKWALSNSGNNLVSSKKHVEEDPRSSPYVEGLDANRHAIAVAAATAAVAEAALAAAHAAAQVVRLTNGGVSRRGVPQYGGGDRRRPVSAAVKIQSAFRAYLARRALRALKGLVKLQALVRGHIVRKQSADMLRRMQAMARIQARASTHRSYTSDYSIYPEFKLSNTHHPDIASVRKYEERPNNSKHGGCLPQQHNSRSGMSNSVNKETSHLASRWLNHWMEQSTWNNLHDTSHESNHGDDERSDKILEVDTWKPHHHNPAPRNDQNAPPTSQYFAAWNNMEQDHSRAGPLSSRHSYKHQKPNPSISSEDGLSVKSHQQNQIAAAFWTAENSPRVHSASSGPTGELRGPFTPARSECSRSFFGDFIGHPNYMANTESSRAKVRSYSAPKQRMQLESLSSKFGRDFWESETISEKGSVLPTNNQSAYRVKRQGTPTRDAAPGYNSVYGRKL